MSSEIEKIEVSHETAQLITARAKARGVTVDTYLRSVAEAGAAEPTQQAGMSLAEIDQILDELAAGSESFPPLPEDFSREDIYYDHD